MLTLLTILFGAVVGFSLGITGGGGSLLAVPLLTYGLHVEPKEAFGISLAAVGATALVGAASRIAQGEVEMHTGLMFALAGMIGAPLGTFIAQGIPDSLLMILFSLLMLTIAWRMWRAGPRPEIPTDEPDKGPSCRRSPDGKLHFTSRCAMVLGLVGMGTGVLSGMFGVGGGFVIVPALVFFTGMSIHRAVATSLLVIVLVSISGVASHSVTGSGISWEITGRFVLGGVVGLMAASQVASRLTGPRLQKVFAACIMVLATFILIRNYA